MKVKESEMVALIKEVITETLEAVKEVYDEEIAPLVKFGSPEKVMEAKYEDWTPEQLEMARFIFGQKLEGFIANKEVNALLELESEV